MLAVSLVNYSCGCEFEILNAPCYLPLLFPFCCQAFSSNGMISQTTFETDFVLSSSESNHSCVLWLSIPMWVLSNMSCRVQSHWIHSGQPTQGLWWLLCICSKTKAQVQSWFGIFSETLTCVTMSFQLSYLWRVKSYVMTSTNAVAFSIHITSSFIAWTYWKCWKNRDILRLC